jgi:iron complex outermembrane receptor protein
VYASASRGFKSGGFNPATTVAGRGFNPEFAWSYETGIKTTLAEGRVRLNAAVFYTDYRDLQVLSFPEIGALDISNAATSTIKGVEIDAATRAIGGLELLTSVSRLDAAYDRYIAAAAGGLTVDAAGHRLNNAPEWSGSHSIVYDMNAFKAGTIRLRGDASWQSRVFFSAFNDAIETQGGYALVHMRASFQPPTRRWELAIYARNLANREYITGTANFPVNSIGGRPGDPRHWGTQFIVRY